MEEKRRAIFLDRDGVINHPKKHYYVYKTEDFIFNHGVFEALRHFQEKGYMLIVITNQGGISKGVYSIEDVDRVHAYMIGELKKEGIAIENVYVCPHHSINEKCLCRKPEPGMIERALARYNIDPLQSWFIGDKTSDVEAGRRAGVNTVKIRKNGNLMKKVVPVVSG